MRRRDIYCKLQRYQNSKQGTSQRNCVAQFANRVIESKMQNWIDFEIWINSEFIILIHFHKLFSFSERHFWSEILNLVFVLIKVIDKLIRDWKNLQTSKTKTKSHGNWVQCAARARPFGLFFARSRMSNLRKKVHHLPGSEDGLGKCQVSNYLKSMSS